MQAPYVFEKEFEDSGAAWAFLGYLNSRYKPAEGLEVLYRDGKLSIKLEKEDPALSRLIAGYFEDSTSAAAVELFCDGGSRGNPGLGACAFVLLDSKGKVLHQGGKFFKHCTNNQAEYWSLKMGVEVALAAGIDRLSIHMDSQLVVRQVKGEYKIKHPGLLPLYQDVKDGLAKLRAYSIVYIPRRHNHLADSLVNQIIDENL